MKKQSNDNFEIPEELAPDVAPEISRIIAVEELKGPHFELDIEATPSECEALCKRFDLIEIEHLSGHLIITAAPDKSIIHAKAVFDASVVQRCGVTLEPVPADLAGEYWCDYAEEIVDDDSTIIEFDENTADPPEPIVNGEFDAGIMFTEHFGLELNPFPRVADADFSKIKKVVGDKLDGGVSDNPFAVLKNLKSTDL